MNDEEKYRVVTYSERTFQMNAETTLPSGRPSAPDSHRTRSFPPTVNASGPEIALPSETDLTV